MRPQVDIQKLRRCYYSYSIRVSGGEERYACTDLYSIAECLRDAATALGLNFDEALISVQGIKLGSHAVAVMEHDSLSLTDRLVSQLPRTALAC